MKLDSLLSKEAVFAHFSARDKKQALKNMAEKAAELSGLAEREIYSTLHEREQRGSTSMGGGVCIPHGRFDGLDKAYALFAHLDTPIDFGAPDAKPVDLMFTLLTPESNNTDHIKALALVSKLLRNKALCDNLRKAPDDERLYVMLEEAGREDAA